MATYNGSRFARQQLASILDQLFEDDEVIVVDDCSTDGTLDIIKSFADSRIVLKQHATNRGVARSFEHALKYASGDIIFLADQDDIWKPEKTAVVVNAFCSNPKITMVVSDAALIDQDGERIDTSYYGQRGQFSDGILSNFVRCKYLGCTMAFRAELLRTALPFPQSRLILHDVWLGMANALSRGQTMYLEQPLVSYRRHSSTVTGTRRLSIAHRFRLRLALALAIAAFWVRQRFTPSKGYNK